MIPFPSHLFPSLPYNPFIQLSDRIVGLSSIETPLFTSLPLFVSLSLFLGESNFLELLKGSAIIGSRPSLIEFVYSFFLGSRSFPHEMCQWIRERERERDFSSPLFNVTFHARLFRFADVYTFILNFAEGNRR